MSSATINRVVLIGRLTRDPELRSLPSGASVCNMRLACNGRQRDASGEYSERPNFFDVSAFGGSAETVAQFMRKGRRVAIDGRLEWREWADAEGQRRQAVSVVADKVLFLDPPREESDGDDGEPAGVGSTSEDGELVF